MVLNQEAHLIALYMCYCKQHVTTPHASHDMQQWAMLIQTPIRVCARANNQWHTAARGAPKNPKCLTVEAHPLLPQTLSECGGVLYLSAPVANLSPRVSAFRTMRTLDKMLRPAFCHLSTICCLCQSPSSLSLNTPPVTNKEMTNKEMTNKHKHVCAYNPSCWSITLQASSRQVWSLVG